MKKKFIFNSLFALILFLIVALALIFFLKDSILKPPVVKDNSEKGDLISYPISLESDLTKDADIILSKKISVKDSGYEFRTSNNYDIRIGCPEIPGDIIESYFKKESVNYQNQPAEEWTSITINPEENTPLDYLNFTKDTVLTGFLPEYCGGSGPMIISDNKLVEDGDILDKYSISWTVNGGQSPSQELSSMRVIIKLTGFRNNDLVYISKVVPLTKYLDVEIANACFVKTQNNNIVSSPAFYYLDTLCIRKQPIDLVQIQKDAENLIQLITL